MTKSVLFSSLLAIATLSLKAQNAPKYSNEFLQIGVGARALGMGAAQSATVADVTAGYWNPAGLVSIKSDLQFALMHSEYFAGIAKYDYGAVAAPIDSTRTVGFSAIRFAVDDIINSLELIDKNGQIDYDRLKTFSTADYGFIFSYASRTKITGLNYGANFKLVHRKVGSFAKAWGFGLDAGVQYQKNKWRFGAMAKDITSTFNAWSYTLTDEEAETLTQTGNELPENGLEIMLPRVILGMGYKANFKKISVTPALDLDVTFDGKRNVLIKSDPISIDPHFGLEVGYNNFIFLRGGVQNIQTVLDVNNKESKTAQPNFGIGVKLGNFSLDYALTNIGGSDNVLYSNIFSLKLAINKQKRNSSL